jgi:hypothetical protein
MAPATVLPPFAAHAEAVSTAQVPLAQHAALRLAQVLALHDWPVPKYAPPPLVQSDCVARLHWPVFAQQAESPPEPQGFCGQVAFALNVPPLLAQSTAFNDSQPAEVQQAVGEPAETQVVGPHVVVPSKNVPVHCDCDASVQFAEASQHAEGAHCPPDSSQVPNVNVPPAAAQVGASRSSHVPVGRQQAPGTACSSQVNCEHSGPGWKAYSHAASTTLVQRPVGEQHAPGEPSSAHVFALQVPPKPIITPPFCAQLVGPDAMTQPVGVQHGPWPGPVHITEPAAQDNPTTTPPADAHVKASIATQLPVGWQQPPVGRGVHPFAEHCDALLRSFPPTAWHADAVSG